VSRKFAVAGVACDRGTQTLTRKGFMRPTDFGVLEIKINLGIDQFCKEHFEQLLRRLGVESFSKVATIIGE